MKKHILVVIITLIGITTFGQTPAKKIQQFNLDKKLALEGYDPVAYFKQNKAVKGKPALSASDGGITYYFSSQENKDSFVKNPSSYEPQYGGWCAFAMGDSGDKVEVDPQTFKILDGKLYLFYNAYFNNTLKSWNKNEASLKKKADASWKKIIN